MPGSAVSAHSSGSHLSSSSSRKAKSRQYYTVAPTSQVDESLFGPPKKWPATLKNHQEPLPQNVDPAVVKRPTKREAIPKPDTVRHVTKDLIRNLVIPREDPSGLSLVLGNNEFSRIRKAAKVPTAEELAAAEEAFKHAKEEATKDTAARKSYMKQKDMERKKNEKLTDLEQEEKEKAEYLRSKANELMQEQEDEIKHLNELILNAKCHAIRDAQLQEKSQISKEMRTEELRLDQMMELDRINAIKVDEEIEKKRKTERLLGAMKLMEQIEEREQERLMDLERKDQENKNVQKYLEQLYHEDVRRMENKHQEQMELREDLNKCNADIIKRREMTKEQERALERKVIEFQKAKAEREAAFEKEQERIRVEKEREVARLRALQERASDEAAERDALRAKRAMEEAERDWRRKEAAEQRQKAETSAMLLKAREMQMKQREHYMAVEAARERAEFENVLKAQQNLANRDYEKEMSRRHASHEYANDVRTQIREKEQLRIAERNSWFDEGIKLDEEARARRIKLDEAKKKKLDQLRAAGVHDRYLSHVERKVTQQPGLAV